MIAYKLFKTRKDGSIGPLFINAKQRVPIGEWVKAEAHDTPGFKFRPGWHCTSKPVAPHLSEKGRAWYKVKIEDVTPYQRPESQGGLWYTAKKMKVLGRV